MDKHYQTIGKQVGLVGAIGGMLLASPVVAMPFNPHGSIFDGRPVAQITQPPLPSQQEPPSTMVTPINGQVSINLMNQTGGPVTYEVIGNTKPRTLQSQSRMMLQNLPTPVTLTFNQKNDGGAMIRVSTYPSSKPGVLDVKLMSTGNWRDSHRSLRIQKRGDVFLN